MSEFVSSAVFVFGDERHALADPVVSNPQGVKVTPVELATFLDGPAVHLADTSHVVVAATLPEIKAVLDLSMAHGFSVGIIPSRAQKKLRVGLGLPQQPDLLLKQALRADPQTMDLILCNGQIMLFNAILGHLPLLDTTHHQTRVGLLVASLARLARLKLRSLVLSTSDGRRIDTAACGGMVIQQHGGSLASRLLGSDSSFCDGMVSVVISAPMSIVEYLKFVLQFLRNKFRRSKLPSTLGYVKSASIDIETGEPVAVLIDGVAATHTPLHCEVRPAAVRMNIGESLREALPGDAPTPERIDIEHLPTGKELSKARDQRIPFFTYASEDRFRDLFTALREDAHTSSLYITLMILSTLLATLGLFLSSASVVIGAMLLAPLMAPIGSLAMGLVRLDSKLSLRSIRKIVVGVVIALVVAALLSLMVVHKPVTAEMEARLNPSLLDLGVAILAGVAAAYTKAFKEILQSLAGVAIAVALVPPLAVAGIGLGRADILFFGQAFLLFFTNLIGITIAAALTFRFLGYSPAVQNKRGLAIVVLLLAIVAVPLHISYRTIVEKQLLERGWKQERFLVGQKYLIVQKADLRKQLDHDVLYVTVLAREPLNRSDLAVLKEKIQTHFNKRLIVRATITYIL